MYKEIAGSCENCGLPVEIDVGEPGEWCSTDNCPDGEYLDECSCGHQFKIMVSWTPSFSIEELEITC